MKAPASVPGNIRYNDAYQSAKHTRSELSFGAFEQRIVLESASASASAFWASTRCRHFRFPGFIATLHRTPVFNLQAAPHDRQATPIRPHLLTEPCVRQGNIREVRG